MKLAILAISDAGRRLASRLRERLPQTVILDSSGRSTKELLAENWQRYDGFLCIMAAGIVVRGIAPLIRDKFSDPCVLVLDPEGRFVISLLSGHVGGGNSLAEKVANITGGVPVITTASDTLGLVPLDLWMLTQNLHCNRQELTSLSTLLVNKGFLKIYSDIDIESLPSGLIEVYSPQEADLIVSHRIYPGIETPFARPVNLVVGIGCNRNTPVIEFEEAFTELLTDNTLARQSIRCLASIDKKNDEIGLLEFSTRLNIPLEFFSSDQINTLQNLEISFAALGAVGAIGVAEPTALLGAASNSLLCRKRKWKNITMAVALAPCTLSAQVRDQKNI